MILREYDPERDKEAVHRIWREIGWTEEKKDEEAMDVFLAGGRSFVAELNGEAECMVNLNAGTIRHLHEDLPLSGVTGVTTSRIARKLGLASRLTAHAVASDAANGATVSLVGVFEQGYYNQLGFGNGSYEHWCAFDPTQLVVSVKPRVPKRITSDSWKVVHTSRLTRLRGHGACNLEAPQITRAEMLWSRNGFGLGYADGANGELTHHLWCSAKNVEDGPYRVLWLAYRTREEFLELLALLKTLGDQVRLIKLCEPSGIQLQDFLKTPIKMLQVTEKSKYESRIQAIAYWQARICDLPACLKRTRLSGESVRFNLVLSDPIEQFLDDDAPWRGIGGTYVVTLGPASSAEPGRDASLPTLTASVGAFTRLWLGVRPATGLAWTDTLSGPQDLLKRLDHVLRLPDPKPDWDF